MVVFLEAEFSPMSPLTADEAAHVDGERPHPRLDLEIEIANLERVWLTHPSQHSGLH